MNLFVKLLKWLGIGVLAYPLVLISDLSSLRKDEYLWLKLLIVGIIVSILLFLFTDFELVRRIKERKKKQN